MSLGAVGTDMRVPLRGKLLQSGTTLGGTFKYVNLFDASGNLIAPVLASAATAAVPAPVGFSGIQVAKAIYDFTVDGGSHTVASGLITPALTVAIPINAIVIGATINSVVAISTTSSPTVAIGTSAGSSASSILTAAAASTLSVDAVLNGSVTLAAPFKMSAAGNVTVTIATADLTTGKLEIYIYFVVSAQA